MFKIARAREAITKTFSVCALIPTFVRQAKQLSSSRQAPRGMVLVLAIASNRLPLKGGSHGVRSYLAELLRRLGGSSSPFSDTVKSADQILIFDPLPLSRFWTVFADCRRENVFIIDGFFLTVFYAIEALSRPRREFREIVALIRVSYREWRSHPSPRQAFTKVLMCAFIEEIYSKLLETLSQTEALLLTSNSSLTELLRAHLFRQENCQVVEIMHGVGTILGERYFSEVIALGEPFGSYRKQFFVPQLPNMPLFGLLKRRLKFDPGVAINTYLNRYAIQELGSNTDAVIESEYRSLFSSDPGGGNSLILAILGSGDTGSDRRRIFDSPTFRAECLLISLIAQFKPYMMSRCVMVYVPHPWYESEISAHPVLVENDIKVYRDSVFCWLIADLCIGLTSSALFEAAYFGAPVFTPLLNTDGYYTTGYLDRLHHPRSRSKQDLVATLGSFLTGFRRSSEVDVIARAKQRWASVAGERASNSTPEIAPRGAKCAL